MASTTLTPESLLDLWRERLLPRLQSEDAPHLVFARPPGAANLATKTTLNGGLRAQRHDVPPLLEAARFQDAFRDGDVA